MKQLTGKFSLFIFIVIMMAACAKETSYESGSNVNGQSAGTLKDSLGECQNITIKGSYKVDTSLVADSNYVLVNINVTTPGQYNIFTDTSNGFWFKDSGYTTAGAHTIKLKGYGKPLLGISTDFIVTYKNSFCIFTVNINATVIPQIFRDYFPTDIGSNWAYDIAGSADTLHVDATSQTASFLSNTYNSFIGKQANVPNDTAYYRKDNSGNYYQYGNFKAFTSATGTTINPFEYIFLKDNQPVGTQWDSPTASVVFQGLPTQVKMHYIILGKNITSTFNGNLMDSVIKIQNDLQFKVLGTFQTISTGYSYYAKNIGLVNVEIPGFYTQVIRRWKIY